MKDPKRSGIEVVADPAASLVERKVKMKKDKQKLAGRRAPYEKSFGHHLPAAQVGWPLLDPILFLLFLFQVPPPLPVADDAGLQGPLPVKFGCSVETKEERTVRRKALKEKWGPFELRLKRQEANTLQRRLRKEAEKARLADLGPQVLFL